MSEANRILRRNLRVYVAYLGTSWAELAAEQNIPYSRVRHWVNARAPSSETLDNLSEMLGVPVHALLDPDFDPRKYHTQ